MGPCFVMRGWLTADLLVLLFFTLGGLLAVGLLEIVLLLPPLALKLRGPLVERLVMLLLTVLPGHCS